MRKRFFLLSLLIIACFLASAQLEVKNHFDILGKKDAAVNVICQDQNGFLLLATNDGLFRFDGKSVTRLLSDRYKNLSNLSALYADASNVLWMGSRNGTLYRWDDHTLDSLTLPLSQDETVAKITSILSFDGALFVSTYGNGLYKVEHDKVQRFNKSAGLSDNVIYKLVTKNNNLLWCATDAGITEIYRQGKQLEFHSISSRNGLPDNIVRDLFYDGKRLLVGMQDSGVCFYDPASKKINSATNLKNWTYGPVLNLHSENNILTIATEKSGLIQIQDGKHHIYPYAETIKSGHVNQLFCDREKSFWLASPKGISHFIENRYHLISLSGHEQAQRIVALAADRDAAIWLATEKQFIKMGQDAQGRKNSSSINGEKDQVTSCAAVAPDGTIWFGTYGRGIIVVSKDLSSKQIMSTSSGDLNNDNVSSIYFDKSDIVYVSTLGGGILKANYNSSTRQFKKLAVYSEKDGLGSDYIYSVVTGTDGLLYAATDGGGLEVLKNGSFQNLTKSFKFQSTTAFSLCRDPMGHITATSNADGLLHFDGKVLRRYRANDGLRDEQPAQIIASNNNLLCVHSKGIDRLNCANNTITYYDLPEDNIEINLNAVASQNGFIYSGTSKGLIVYRTGKVRNDSIAPKIYLRQLYLNYKPIKSDSLTRYRHNQNSLGFAFAGIWMKHPELLKFRYRLAGLEEEWQSADEEKTVTYNNLLPGNYTFYVQSQNDEDVWSESYQYAFEIQPPLWARWWFWMLNLIAFVLLIYFFVQYRLKALQRENVMLEERVRLRTEQIAKQAEVIEEKNKVLEQLSLVASKTDNVVLILDAEGNLEYVNESFERLNGMSLSKLRERYGRSIFELSNNADIRKIIDNAIKQKRSVNYESLNKKVSGSEIWESSTLTPIFDDSGSLRKIIIIDTDVTLRKKQEQIIIQKNKDITDSISYARKIQHAILPAVPTIQKHIPELFVLYMTKDIVSGDFFWFGHFENYSIIAAVDCTGHGVPGAFMSLIGYNQLNRIVNENKIHDPSLILKALNEGVLAVLHKNESESKDGMDVAICKIDHVTNTLEYAGAMRPLWIVEGETPELVEIKADKIPIGTNPAERDKCIAFTNHTMTLNPGAAYYIFTDGYADQFGGTRDKKYSTARFKELLKKLHNLPFREKKIEIEKEHFRWKGDNEQVDDILVIGFGRPLQ